MSTPNLPVNLLGKWQSRVIADPNGGGMIPSGPNPPFVPLLAEQPPSWDTVICANGTGKIKYRDWYLKGTLANNNKLFYGHYAIQEHGYLGGPNGDFSYGEFCIMYTTGMQLEPIFVGVAKNRFGAWQAWWGTSHSPSQDPIKDCE